MSKSSRIPTRRVLALSAFAAFAGLAASALCLQPAYALPTHGTCSITYYYSDPGLTNQVGTYSTCPTNQPKRGLTGRKTRYYEVETIDFGNTGPGGTTGGGGLPCEFTAVTIEQQVRC